MTDAEIVATEIKKILRVISDLRIATLEQKKRIELLQSQCPHRVEQKYVNENGKCENCGAPVFPSDKQGSTHA